MSLHSKNIYEDGEWERFPLLRDRLSKKKHDEVCLRILEQPSGAFGLTFSIGKTISDVMGIDIKDKLICLRRPNKLSLVKIVKDDNGYALTTGSQETENANYYRFTATAVLDKRLVLTKKTIKCDYDIQSDGLIVDISPFFKTK